MTTIIFTVFPLLIAACGMLKKRPLICTAAGALIFFCTFLCLSSAAPSLSADYAVISAGGTVNSPIGFSYPAQLLSLLFPDSSAVSIVVSAIFAFSVSAYIYKSELPSFSAVLFAAGAFWLYFVHNPIVFIAAALFMNALKYAYQRDFVRCAALILLGVCFYPEMWVLLLLIPFLALPVGIPLLAVGIAVGAVIVYINPADFLFKSMSADPQIFPVNGISVLIPAALFTLFILAVLTRKMFRKKEYSDTMIITLFAAAVLSLMSVSDTRFAPLAITLAAPSVLSLGGEIFIVGKRLLSMTFREKAKTAEIIALTAVALILAAFYGAVLSHTGVIF